MRDNEQIILGIETSCDDTSVAILKSNRKELPTILSHSTFSQEKILAEWGGIIPEIASRNHLAKLLPLLKLTFKEAALSPKDIDLIGVTVIPGLLGPLLTGLNAAKSLSLIYETQILPVNHLFAHIEAIRLTDNVPYPYLGLVVSGGHTVFFLVKDRSTFELLGSTIDDAAGEAFDKGGKMLGLSYPAGRVLDDLAKKGNPLKHSFKIALKHEREPNLSFSGVKTELKNFLLNSSRIMDELKNKQGLPIEERKYSEDVLDLIASYQHAIVSAISFKMKQALSKIENDNIPIVVGGGVACNSYLRQMLTNNFKNVFFVKPSFCTDNGAMIANYALINIDDAVKFPSTLSLDASSRFISKNQVSRGLDAGKN